MENEEYRWLIEQKRIMSRIIMSTARKLQNARKQIAEPYVYALEKQFPNAYIYKLIRVVDEDLQNSNKYYRQLTNKLAELINFSQNSFQGLVELIKQTQP